MIGLRPLIEELADHLFEIQSRILLGELGIRRKGTPSDMQDDGWSEQVNPCTQIFESASNCER